MARFSRGLVVTLGFLLLGLFITIVPQKNASGQGNSQPVIVKNTPLPTTVTNTPLPISGNVNVGNFPATQNVNVTNPITGTVTANINSLPNVNATITNSPLSALITNPTTNPVLNRNIDRPENQPFNFVLCTAGGPNSFTQQEPCAFGGTTSLQFVQVPTTTSNGQMVQRFVIEYASGACSAAPSSIFAVNLSTGSAANFVSGTSNQGDHFFTVTNMTGQLAGGGSVNFVTWAQPMRSYNDPGGFVGFFVNGTGTIVGCTMYISGYLTTM